jgi:hypothetical protein
MADMRRQDFATNLPDLPPFQTWDRPEHLVAPPRSFQYCIDFISVGVSGRGDIYCLAQQDMSTCPMRTANRYSSAEIYPIVT